jgi:hypothetical protein
MIRKGFWLVFIGLFMLVSASALAQNARLSGLVTEASGAVVVNVRVVAVNKATGIARETVTTDAGLYVIEGLPPAIYEVSCEAKGFKRFVSPDNTLTAGQQAELNIRLEPGEISEVVTVTESMTRVQTGDTQVSTTITGPLVRELPLNGRNPLHLILSGAPGISGRGTNINVNGQKTQSVNTTVDGIDANDATLGRAELSLVPINPDTVQEYQLITSNFKAEYGRSTGAQVSVVTKSGGNSFHGSVYEFHRNTAFNANDFFNNSSGVQRPVLLRHQFGASIGGPIKKDKAFFFFNYDGFRQSQSIPTQRTVLTQQARQGIFRYAQGIRNTITLVDAGGNYIGSAPLQIYDIIAKDPLRIRIDPVMAGIIDQTPLPNSFTGGDGLNTALFRFNAPSTTNNNTYTTRVDYNFNANHSAAVRYTIGQFLTDGDSINSGLQRYPGLVGRNQQSRRQGASVSLRSTFSPVLQNEFTFGFQRSTVRFNNPQYPDTLTIVSSSFTDPVNPFAGTGRVAPVFQLKDSLTKTHGAHTFKFGTDIRFTQFNQFRRAGTFPIYPQLNISRTLFPVAIPDQPASSVLETNNANTLRGLMMDVLGVWGRAQQTFFGNGEQYLPTGGNYVRGHRSREYDFFVQDDWRFRPNLTLNYGVRYEYKPPVFEVNGIMFVPDNPNFSSQPGTVSFSRVGKDGDARWFNKDLNNFAPVVGFSWDPKGDGKTAVRASYRFSYDRVTSWIVNDSDQTTPGASFDATQLNQGSLAEAGRIASFTSPLAPPATFTTLAPNNRAGRPLLFDRNFRTPYVQQWVLSLQREVFKDTVVELIYLGNKGTRLYRNYNINQIEIEKNGVLSSFLIAQNNLALAKATTGARVSADYNPAIPGSQPVGVLQNLFPNRTIPTGQNNNIEQGQIGAVINNVDNSTNLAKLGLPETFFRPYPQFELLGYGCTCSNSTYNSLQAQVTRRYSGGLTVQASWTWSKAIDEFSGRGDGIWVVRDLNQRSLEKGRADFDATHIVRGSFIYDLPIGKGKRWLGGLNGVANQLLGGWQMNGLLDAATGNPMTVVSGRQTMVYTPFTDGLSNADFSGSRLVDFGGIARDSQGRVVYFTEDQRSQFSFPAAGTVGTTGRNAFTGPGYWNFDFSLYKNFRVTEQVKIQFRSEFFNVFNHPIMDEPTVNLSMADFGRITEQRNTPRVMQFALRIDF